MDLMVWGFYVDCVFFGFFSYILRTKLWHHEEKTLTTDSHNTTKAKPLLSSNTTTKQEMPPKTTAQNKDPTHTQTYTNREQQQIMNKQHQNRCPRTDSSPGQWGA